MEGRYKVGEVMANNVIVSSPNETIYECAQKMANRRISSLIVVDGLSVIGIITEQDIARKVVAKGLKAQSTRVNMIMSNIITSIDPNKEIQDAIQIMGNNEIKHLPVIENEKLVGIITSKDIVAIEPVLMEMLKFNHSHITPANTTY
jgi:predicted transcriptional regulator